MLGGRGIEASFGYDCFGEGNGASFGYDCVRGRGIGANFSGIKWILIMFNFRFTYLQT